MSRVCHSDKQKIKFCLSTHRRSTRDLTQAHCFDSIVLSSTSFKRFTHGVKSLILYNNYSFYSLQQSLVHRYTAKLWNIRSSLPDLFQMMFQFYSKRFYYIYIIFITYSKRNILLSYLQTAVAQNVM